MTSSSQPPEARGSKASKQDYELQNIGKSGSHTFTDQTSLVEDYSQNVPRLRLYEGAPWEHEVSVAWEKGGIWGVIVLVASYIFSCVSPPSLINTDSENRKANFELIALKGKGKPFGDSEVQTILRKIFPDTSAVAREWAGVQNKPPKDIQEFLAHVEKQYREIEKLNLGLSEFVDQAKEEILNYLNDLKRQGAQKLVQAWRHKCKALKQFPIERDPVVFFKFYQSLEAQLKELGAYNTSPISSVPEPITAEITELEELKNAVKKEIPSRLEKVQQTLKERMPLENLRATAKKENIDLPQEHFGAQADHFQKKIQQKIQNAAQTAKLKAGEAKNLEADLVGLRKDRAACEEKPLSLLMEKITKLEAAQKAHEKELTDNELKVSETILERQKVVEKLETTQQSLKAKKESLWGISGTEGEQLLKTETQLTQTQTEIKQLEIIRADLANLPSTALQKNTNEIERDFTEKKEANEKEMQRLENEIAQKSLLHAQATSAWQAASNEVSRLKKVNEEFIRVWDAQLARSDMQDDCKLFTRLTFLKGAFEDYQENPQPDPVRWPQIYYAKSKNSFNTKLLSSLKALGIREDSLVYQETLRKISHVILPDIGSPPIDRSGLEEFP